MRAANSSRRAWSSPRGGGEASKGPTTLKRSHAPFPAGQVESLASIDSKPPKAKPRGRDRLGGIEVGGSSGSGPGVGDAALRFPVANCVATSTAPPHAQAKSLTSQTCTARWRKFGENRDLVVRMELLPITGFRSHGKTPKVRSHRRARRLLNSVFATHRG